MAHNSRATKTDARRSRAQAARAALARAPQDATEPKAT